MLITSLYAQVMPVMMMMIMTGSRMILITVLRSTILHRGQEIVTMIVMLMEYLMTQMPALAIKIFRWQTLTTSSPSH